MGRRKVLANMHLIMVVSIKVYLKIIKLEEKERFKILVSNIHMLDNLTQWKNQDMVSNLSEELLIKVIFMKILHKDLVK